MKILLKDKTNLKLKSLNQKLFFVYQIKKEFSYDDFISIFGMLNALAWFVGLAILFKNGLFLSIAPAVILSAGSFILYKSLYFKKAKQIHHVKTNIALKIKNLEDINSTLNISENYQLYYNELITLKGSNQLEKINPLLVQEIIEEYRKKDNLNLPALSNEKRLEYFTVNEMNNSKLFQNKEQLVCIENN